MYHNLKGGVPYLLPAIGLAFFISRKGGLTLAEDKKNIGPKVEKTDTAPAPEQPAPRKAEPVVADPAPGEKAAPVEKAEPDIPEAPGSALPSRPSPTRPSRPIPHEPGLEESGHAGEHDRWKTRLFGAILFNAFFSVPKAEE